MTKPGGIPAARPRSGPAARIPVTLVTGFLGSGKTTLINAVLRDPAFAHSLVIVNEFGEIGLDHELIENADDGVVLLDSGCLCCAATGTLRDTLIALFARGPSGPAADIQHIIVETSGLANPGPLVATLIGDSALQARCALAQVLTLIDPVNGIVNLARFAEARHQAAYADTLVITKMDLAGSEPAGLRRRLEQLNPRAPIQQWQAGQPAAPLFASAEAGSADTATATGRGTPDIWVERLMHSGRAVPLRLAPQGRQAHGGGTSSSTSSSTSSNGGSSKTSAPLHIHSAAYADITSCTLQFPPAALGWSAYAALTSMLSARLGRKLLRCKGVLHLGPQGQAHIVQGVQGYFAAPQPFTRPAAPERGFLVCILEGITPEDFLALLRTLPDMPNISLAHPNKDMER